MKRMIAMLTAFVWGCLLAFFGVFVSVFADGGAQERAVVILVILGIYLVSGAVCTFWGRFWTWQWSVLLWAPAALILFLYSFQEMQMLPYFLGYIAAILIFAWAGTKAAGLLRKSGSR